MSITFDFELDCTNCEEEQPAVQKPGDPEHIYRCGECGKKHSEDSLVLI